MTTDRDDLKGAAIEAFDAATMGPNLPLVPVTGITNVVRSLNPHRSPLPEGMEPSPLEVVDMQIALQLQGLGTGLAANGIWNAQWAELYRLWLEAHRDGPEA